MTFHATITHLVIRPASAFLTLWLCADLPACGQGLYNASTMRIDGVEIHIGGELYNTGELDNNGLISFTGDWNNGGKYKGEGTVEARGYAPQKIAHDGQNMARLLINGWGTKYIHGKVIVTNKLHLQEGILEVSSDDLLKLHRSAVISGGSEVSFIDGPLTVEGNGYKFFPIGKNGTYAPIEFVDVKGPLAEYAMEVFENPPLIPLEQVVVKSTHYWKRTDIAGSFGSSVVAIDYDASQFTNPDDMILVAGAHWDEPFDAIREIEHSRETHKIITKVEVSAPIIMLAEGHHRWVEADFYLPTALSPNASRLENRSVKVFGDRLADDGFHFQVFNRWGEVVYESMSLDEMASNGWDGRSVRGSALATGVYPYRLTAVDKLGRAFEKNGVITIVH